MYYSIHRGGKQKTNVEKLFVIEVQLKYFQDRQSLKIALSLWWIALEITFLQDSFQQGFSSYFTCNILFAVYVAKIYNN